MINSQVSGTKNITIDTDGGRSPATVYRTIGMKLLIAAATAAYFLAAWVPFILISGCAVRQVKIIPPAGPQVVIPRNCMDKVELTDATECRGPVDGTAPPRCIALKLTYRVNCTIVEAKPKP